MGARPGDRGVDLDGDHVLVKKAAPGNSLQRNKFWALASSDGDDSEDADGGALVEISSPTPSYLVCESLRAGRLEAEVAGSIAEIVPPGDSAWDGLNHDDGM